MSGEWVGVNIGGRARPVCPDTTPRAPFSACPALARAERFRKGADITSSLRLLGIMVTLAFCSMIRKASHAGGIFRLHQPVRLPCGRRAHPFQNMFPPIPSELILPLSGFLATQTEMTLPGVIIAATVGSVVGAHLPSPVSAACSPKSVLRGSSTPSLLRMLGFHSDDVAKAIGWFDRKGQDHGAHLPLHPRGAQPRFHPRRHRQDEHGDVSPSTRWWARSCGMPSCARLAFGPAVPGSRSPLRPSGCPTW